MTVPGLSAEQGISWTPLRHGCLGAEIDLRETQTKSLPTFSSWIELNDIAAQHLCNTMEQEML
jgi:hypothetical protein